MTETKQKMRYSKQREQIYDYLRASKAHPSAEMIYEDIRHTNAHLSLGTVYRNLKLLEELGKIQRVTSLRSTERYDARCDTHAHFACDSCGSVFDLSIVDVQEAQHACGVDNFVQVLRVNITFGGLCDSCLQKASNLSD